jgi:hypothetical protein
MAINFKAKGCVHTALQIQDELEKHETLFGYHLAAFDRETCSEKQDKQLAFAAQHAAIITALKSYPHGELTILKWYR